MKKLLLLGLILAIGTAVFAGPFDRGYTKKGDYGGGPGMEALGGFDGVAGMPQAQAYGIQDNKNHTILPGGKRVNLFLAKGDGYSYMAETKVFLEVIRKVKIQAESSLIKTHAVIGDELSLGDIMFKVNGGAPTTITFEFKNVSSPHKNLFNLKGNASVTEIGGSQIAKTHKFKDLVVTAEPQKKCGTYEKEFEVDLYFDLRKLKNRKAGCYLGNIVATAQYD